MEGQWIVTYSVVGIDRKFTTGPYGTWDEGYQHFTDIRGYEGVFDVRLEPLERASKKDASDCPYDHHADDCDCQGMGGDR